MVSEDRVNKRRQRLHACRNDEHDSHYTKENGQRQHPAFGRTALPHPTHEGRDRPARTAEHDQAAFYLATLLEHAIFSFCAANDARFTTRVRPATNTSIPLRRNVEYPSTARLTMGSPARLNDVLSSTGKPLRRP